MGCMECITLSLHEGWSISNSSEKEAVYIVCEGVRQGCECGVEGWLQG